MKKKFKVCFSILLAIMLALFVSCDFMPKDETDLVDPNGPNWKTLKKNIMNLDFPKTPNYAAMTDDEFDWLMRDMHKDPQAAGGRVWRDGGSFFYEERNQSYELTIEQEPDGDWWGSMPLGTDHLVLHLTNAWPDHFYASILPAKPGLKFWGETIEDTADGGKSWYGAFVGYSQEAIRSSMNAWKGKMLNAGWDYSKGDGYEIYSKRYADGFAIVGVLYNGPHVIVNVEPTFY